MPVHKTRGKPIVGTTCSRTHKGKTYTMIVIKTSLGIGYKVGGDIFRTPTSAAKSITQKDVNGWVFWGLD